MGLGFSVLGFSWGSVLVCSALHGARVSCARPFMGLGFRVLGLAVLVARAGELFIAITAVIADYCGVSSVFLGLTIAAGIYSCYWHYTILIVMIGIVFGCCWY